MSQESGVKRRQVALRKLANVVTGILHRRDKLRIIYGRLSRRRLGFGLSLGSEWTFHLDLWQNPYAVARYYNVAPFSQEHFDLMRPIMKRYADAVYLLITL